MRVKDRVTDFDIIGARAKAAPPADDLPLFATSVPPARTTDPETSHDGGQDARERAREYRRCLLRAYDLYGPMTAREAAIAAEGVPMDSCWWKRVSELHADGYLMDTGQTSTSYTGSRQTIYQITPEGLAARAALEARRVV
jgi:beta-lactamase superfamily II metal-dependent hydrolase